MRWLFEERLGKAILASGGRVFKVKLELFQESHAARDVIPSTDRDVSGYM